MNKIAFSQWIHAFAISTFVFSSTGCLTTLQPPAKRFAVAPGLILGKIEYRLNTERTASEEVKIDERFGIRAFLKEGYAEQRTGIYLAEPFDPDRIPVLFVHGLLDDPFTWRKMTAGLHEDPIIRENYQFWYYAYPSSLPVLGSSAIFRQHLDQAVANIEEETGTRMDRRLIVVGHSMGGMLTKSLISDTGDALWDSAFTAPMEELDVDEEARQFLTDTFTYEPRPYMKKAIFLASPHRGSRVAQSPVGAIGTLLADRPEKIGRVVEQLLTKNYDQLTPGFQDFLSGRVTSINTLRPDAPALEVVAKLPIDPEVEFHSIAGVKRKSGKGDGIVPLESTFIDGALCEAGIYSGHGVHKTEEAITLVDMILKLHVGEITEDEAWKIGSGLDLAFARHEEIVD